MSVIKPTSVLDVGCGQGVWLNVAKAAGATRVVGLDGDYVDRAALQIEPAEFTAIDLSSTFPEPIRVDMAISLEVAEHLPASRGDALVEFLTACADVVLFSAAVPGQGGTDHINEQWQSFWAEKFERRGYAVSTQFRDQLWEDQDIGVWYRQNALVYVKKGSANEARVRSRLPTDVIDMVHPQLYTMKMQRYRVAESGLARLQKVVNKIRALR